jgi:F-type H+-transporting ATPase subunit epsilon
MDAQEPRTRKRQLHVSLVTPDGSLYNKVAREVVLPGTEGQLTILTDHTPLVTSLASGDLIIKREGTADRKFVTRGGFAEVSNNEVTILVDAAREV